MVAVSDNRTVVIKVGSSTLSATAGGLDADYVDSLVAQIAQIAKGGWKPVFVSSGAIAAGIQVLGLPKRPTDMPTLQAAASIGQVELVKLYSRLFENYGLSMSQVLLTRRDTAHRASYLHARNTFGRLLSFGVIPVVNENDTVAVDEIRFGDNDTLAALVAVMIGATKVMFLTDTEGLYTADPRNHADAELVSEVTEVTDHLMATAGAAGSSMGAGGMSTKVKAAKLLMRAAIPLVICDGRRPDVIIDGVSGLSVGTTFVQESNSMSARKLWIAMGSHPLGAVTIDDGARKALLSSGGSLLPAGVIGVEGTFSEGDTVELKDAAGNVIGQGIAGMSSVDVERVKGLKSAEIQSTLSGVASKAVIHRDQMVLL